MPAIFFITMPTPTGTFVTVGTNSLTVYRDAATGEELKWSAAFPLPARGTRIYVTMNNLGWASVEGYFSEAGYLGVMTKLEKLPKRMREQQKIDAADPTTPEWVRQGIGCEFGAEIRLAKPRTPRRCLPQGPKPIQLGTVTIPGDGDGELALP